MEVPIDFDMMNNKHLETAITVLKPIVIGWIKQALEITVPCALNENSSFFCEQFKENINNLLEKVVIPLESNVSRMITTSDKLANRIQTLENELSSCKQDIANITKKVASCNNGLQNFKCKGDMMDSKHRTHEDELIEQGPTSSTPSPNQYSRLRIVGLAESTSTIDKCLEDLFSDILGTKFEFSESVRSVRKLGQCSKERKQTVLVYFKDKNTRDQIYMSRWKLGYLNCRIFINEDLTKEVYQQFKSIRTFAQSMGIKKVWTYNDDIIVKFKNKKMKVKSIQELKHLFQKSN